MRFVEIERSDDRNVNRITPGALRRGETSEAKYESLTELSPKRSGAGLVP